MEVLRLRVKDLDFANHQIIVRAGKGEDDRSTIMPESVIADLRRQLETAKKVHRSDLKEGFGEAILPYALDRKYPNAGKEWSWQYIFPANQRSRDPLSGKICRHHLDESVLQKAIREAARLAEIDKPVGPHTFRQRAAYL